MSSPNSAEFSFGYDLAPGSYDVVDTPAGIEVRVAGPTVVAAPAVRDLHHQVLASGWFTDERADALKLYEDSSNVARAEGARMQSDAEIVALLQEDADRVPARLPCQAAGRGEGPGDNGVVQERGDGWVSIGGVTRVARRCRGGTEAKPYTKRYLDPRSQSAGTASPAATALASGCFVCAALQ